MNVHIKLFAGVREAAGRDCLDVALPEHATVGQLRAALHNRMPQLSPWWDRAMFAVDRQYASDDLPLAGAQEVACIPPVSGG